jgi:hypothetical protein
MKKYIVLLLLAVIIVACHPEPDNKLLIDDFVVATNHEPNTNFGSYITYAIPTDTIGFVSETSNDTIIVAGESSYPRLVLNAINNNLQTRGYSRVAKNQNPDIGINVLVVNDYNVFQQVVYPSGGYGYPGSYYSGYYGYNSWYYYPYINTYAYNTGILIVEMVDLKNRTPDNKVKVVWDAYMGDVYSTLDLQQQTLKAIDQAFTQSPYIVR